MVFWESTAACNLYCKHCRRLDEQPATAPADISTDQARQIIRQVADCARASHSAATTHPAKCVLVFSGGEPLLRDDLYELAQVAKEAKLVIALATNGTLIDANAAATIARTGFNRVSISLDGPDAATHDRLRGTDGAFDAAVRGIKLLLENRVPVQINCSVFRDNMAALPRMHQLALDLGVTALHLFMLVPVGCGAQVPPEQMLTAAEYERTLHWVIETKLNSPIHLRATCAPHYYRISSQYQADGAHGRNDKLLEAHTRGCLAGISVCFISHDAKVFPCGYLPLPAGDLNTQGLTEIWQDCPLFNQLRDFSLLKGKCGRCTYKTICGGCRARAYGLTGDHLAAEPFCNYNPPKA